MTLKSATLYWLLINLLRVPALANGNPGDVSAINGTRVTLSCTLLPATGTGTLTFYQWRREKTLGYWDLLVDEPVVEDGYEMTIDSSTGQSEFTITAVDLGDDGRFFCESTYVPTPPGGSPVDNMSVTVLVELDNIKMMDSNKEYNDGDSVMVVDGNDSMFTCASQANKPEAIFNWTVADKAPDSAPSTSKTPNADDSRLWDSTSDYTYTALWEHHDAAIICTARNEALPSGIGTSIVLDVKVPPKDGHVTLSDPAPYDNLPSGAVRQDIEHVFQCNVAGTRPESEISWRKGGQAQTGQTSVEQDGLLYNTFGHLNFVPNRNDHQLVLHCEADIEVTGAQTVIKQLTLDVYGPPDDPSLTGDTEFIEQIESDLICNAANGFPGGGKFNWFKDGTLIQNGGTDIPNGDRFDIRDTYNLTPSRSDNGKIIRCQVQHETLKEPPYPATETTINVKFCPASVSITQCPSVEVGQSATLSCTSSSSNPQTSIEWYEKNNKLQNTDQPTYPPSEYNGFNTTQMQDTRVINRGDYMDVEFSCCAVINSEAGCNQLCSGPCVLNVLYSPENVEVSKSSSDPVEEGASITLTCAADGNPEPDSFTWHHDSSVDIGDGTDTLVLDSIEKGDSGYYTCVAENGISPDKASEQSAVIVHYSPIIEEETDSRGVNPGEDVTFDCKAEGLPNPAITWYNPDENTISNDTERMTIVDRIIFQDGVHGTVIVSNLRLEDVLESEYGTYVCQATNSIGQPDLLRVHLNGTTVPEPVKALNITEVTLNSITVEWTAGYSGGEKLEQSFVVDFRRYTDNTAGEWSEAIEITKGDTHYQVTGLLEETKYDIRVFSKNDIGRNENGQITTGSTGYGEPITPTADVRTGPVVDPSTGPVIDPNIGGIVGGVIVSIAAITVVAILIIYFRKQIFGDMFIETKRTNRANESFRQVVYSKNEVEMTGIDNNTFGNEHDEQSALALKDECYANVSTLRFAFPRNNLNIVKELGHGEFGRVLMAEAKGLLQDGYTSTVAVKTLKDSAGETEKNQLQKEFEVMKLLTTAQKERHPNVVQLLGACMENDPMYVILEYMPKGDLKTLLRKSRVRKREIISNSDSAYGNLAVGCASFTPPQLVTFARDVSNGMAFLAEQKCIHRDLAARNVLLNEHLVCKVSDFGLARDVMDVEIYQRLNECRLPVRWMAYESVIGDVHTIESDVWSFGVLLWEIVTLGGRPYTGMNGVEIRQLLKAGNRMPQPKHCSQQLYTIISMCWEKDPKNRPTFVQLINLLEDIIVGQMGYLSMEDLETTLYEDSSAPDANEKV